MNVMVIAERATRKRRVRLTDFKLFKCIVVLLTSIIIHRSALFVYEIMIVMEIDKLYVI